MTTAAVFTAAVVAFAAPDLVTIAESLRARGGRHRRRESVWPLVSVMVVAHTALGVAALLDGRGVS
jgi:hypothetical protein